MDNSQKIETIIKLLYEREKDYEKAAKDYAEIEHTYRMAKAAAFLTADGTVEQRKFIADKACWEQMKAKLAAEAVLEITKAKLLDARQVLSARQSLLSAEVRIHGAVERFSA